MFLRVAEGEPEAGAFRARELLAAPRPWFTNAGLLADVDGDGHPDLLLPNRTTESGQPRLEPVTGNRGPAGPGSGALAAHAEGLHRVALQPGGMQMVRLAIAREALRWRSAETHSWHLEPGPYRIDIGTDSLVQQSVTITL